MNAINIVNNASLIFVGNISPYPIVNVVITIKYNEKQY